MSPWRAVLAGLLVLVGASIVALGIELQVIDGRPTQLGSTWEPRYVVVDPGDR